MVVNLSTIRTQPAHQQWLVYYNNERPHQGYRNRGKRPINTVNEYLASLNREA